MDHDLALYGLGIAVRAAPGPTTTPRPIVAVAVADGHTDRVFTGAEAFLLTRLDEFLADQPAGVLVTRGPSGLELVYLADRAHRLRVPTGLRLRRGASGPAISWHDHGHLDAGLTPDPGGPPGDADRAAHHARLTRRVLSARLASGGGGGPDVDDRTAAEVPVG